MKQPSEIPSGLAPGALSRYDDFTATHINLTLSIHGNGIFLPWHRHFVWLFQKELEDKCQYRGPAPYWNWPEWAGHLSHSPIFDGSMTSLSGNGDWDPNGEVPTFNGGSALPRGCGGGCVTNGPFAGLIIPFQHFAQGAVFEFNGTLPKDALAYQPRCLRRDLSKYLILALETFQLTFGGDDYISITYTNQSRVDYLIRKSPSMDDFVNVMETQNQFGVHPGGHYSVGPSMWDFFASPGDPVFYLHHGMIDLVWTLWQAAGAPERYTELSGGNTTFNIPPATKNTTLDDLLDFGYLDKKRRVRDVMNPTHGLYCYRYKY